MGNNSSDENNAKRISSPEQLNDYLRVTKPAVWIVLVAVAALFVGILVWACFVQIGSSAAGGADTTSLFEILFGT